MKELLIACVVAVVVAVVAVYVLDMWQAPVEMGFSSPSGVRL
jgi:hypothetical protein